MVREVVRDDVANKFSHILVLDESNSGRTSVSHTTKKEKANYKKIRQQPFLSHFLVSVGIGKALIIIST
jgi:hypothetical protein